MKRFRALLLDFYGTLVEEDERVIAGIVRDIASASPVSADPGEIGRSWVNYFLENCQAARGADFKPQRVIELASLERLLAGYQVDLDPRALAERLYDNWRHPRPFPDAVEFLAANQLPVCIVSNIDEADLRAALAHVGWHFDLIVTSEACRSYKPHPTMFERALALLGCRPEEALHIGDSLASDVAGAKALGIAAAWVNRTGRTFSERPTPGSSLVPDYTIESLAGIDQIL